MMKKSDFLDELRLEVGLAYDYASSQEDFIVRILKTIHTVAKREAVLTIHSLQNEKLKLTYALGIRGLTKKQELFGQGFLFPDRLQMVTFIQKENDQVLFLPIYDRGNLKFVISVKLMNSNYKITRQDIIFAQELAQFIQAKQSTFQ
ncbi:hypothetical protein [Alkalicoccus saliphilus]|uniref:Uncharacterized protein n=1 Tax=Alkalicoccus saliphilus TaxID=200989 RepID=A0A2T4U268_9BACI|nr:hypothetical protein [Alkalicoccus saliphilus]PTL37500.1 hypothetical protein C6Y45_16180 [Alkalicoccus saliphilus]